MRRTLPNGWSLDGPRPCQSKPSAAPRLLPEAGDQGPQYQTHPHEPEEHHSQPVVLFGVVQCSAVEGCRSACHSLCAKLRTSLR